MIKTRPDWSVMLMNNLSKYSFEQLKMSSRTAIRWTNPEETDILLVDHDPIPYYAEPIRLFISSTISFIGSGIFKNKSKVSNKDNLK